MVPPNDPAGPFRTCIGCRAKRRQTELVRCVLDTDGIARVDRRGRDALGGRGAWLCGAECLELAIRRNAFDRAWRTSPRVLPGALAALGRELSGTN